MISFSSEQASHHTVLLACMLFWPWLSHSIFRFVTIKLSFQLQPFTVSLHGIEIDTIHMQMRLPQDKLASARLQVDAMCQRKKVSLREIQSLIGTLIFACKVVVPGRTFLRRLIDLIKGVSNPNHSIRLNAVARLDLSAWKLFLDQYNGISFVFV